MKFIIFIDILMFLGKIMKLKKRGKQKYYTYEITMQKQLVEALGWNEGTELNVKLINNKKSLLVTLKSKTL